MMKKVLLITIVVILNPERVMPKLFRYLIYIFLFGAGLFQHLSLKAQCVPVSITTQPTNQNDSVPGHAHFNITAGGTAPFNYYWYVNGVLTDSTVNSASASNIYNTPPLIMADSNNTYYCVVTNCAGANTITSNIEHLICIPVSISIQPLSQTFTAGNNDTISFSVAVNGTPPFTYRWYGPSGLVKTTIDTLGHRSIYSFYAHPVVYGMNGNTYHVTISNHCGGSGNLLVSGNAVLTVICPSIPAPSAWVSASGLINTSTQHILCGGGFITLSTNAVSGASYNWTEFGISGSIGNSQNTNTFIMNNQPFTSDLYTFEVTITLNGCISNQGFVSLYVEVAPSINPPSNQTICSGSTLSYIPNLYPINNGGGYVTYSHSTSPCITGATNGTGNINNVLINTGTSPCTINYTITPFDQFGYCPGTPVSFSVTVNPTPPVTVTSPTICVGDTATITANGAATYIWSAGATSIGVNTATASPPTTSTYTVTGTNTYGCHNTAVSTVTVLNILNTAVTQTADTLTSNQSGATYQWYNCAINGLQPIIGATNQTYVPPVNGQYAVAVTLGSCVDTSACQLFYSVGVPSIDNNQSTITISPNPFTSQTTITFSQEQKNTIIKTVNLLGETIQQQTTSNKQLTIDMSNYAKGIYFVQITDENKNLVNRKIVVQ